VASNRAGRLTRGICAVLLGTSVAGCGADAIMTPVSFHDARVVRGDATLIRLSADSCKSQPYQVRISESAREVRIALAAATPEGPPFPACSDLVAVRLKKPLGSRRLWTPPPIAKCLIEQDRTFSPKQEHPQMPQGSRTLRIVPTPVKRK
jgi:hypothetical protein